MKADANSVLMEEGADRLRAITDGAQRYAQPRRFALTAFADIKVDEQRLGYLVKNLLASTGLAVIWGPPKCGKSFWAVDLGLHISLGWEYRGRRVQQAVVVYVALEGQHGMPARIEAFRRHHGVAAAPFYLVMSRLNLIADAKHLVEDIKAQIPKGITVGGVFIDTLNRSLVGSESKDEDMAKYLAAAELVASELQSAVAIVHHCGIDASRPRGHTSLTGSVESQLAVKKGALGEVIVTVEYAKDFAEGAEIVSQLEQVTVGVDPDGDDITTLVVLPSDQAAMAVPAKQPREAKSKRTFRDAVAEALHSAGQDIRVLDDGPIVRAVEVEHVRTQFYRRHVTGEADAGKATEARKKAFQRAIKELPSGISSATQQGSEWLWLTQ
jgi:hypothetical protein